jgi:hypothetical protein
MASPKHTMEESGLACQSPPAPPFHSLASHHELGRPLQNPVRPSRQDDFIAAATAFASLQSVSMSLLTLMVSDEKEKPSGKSSTYVPRGFLTLDDSSSSNRRRPRRLRRSR